MATLRDHWSQVPRLSRMSWVSFVVLTLATVAVGAVFFPDGGQGLSFVFIPVGLDLALIGVLTLTNYRGTADSLLGLQQAMERHLPTLGPRSSRGFNRFVASMFIVAGLGVAIGAPLTATKT